MSCIVLSAQRVGKPLECSSERIGEALDAYAYRIDMSMSVDASRMGEAMSFGVARVGKPMEVSASLVCEVNGEFYLRVSPEIIWLDPNDATVYVESNVNWIIE